MICWHNEENNLSLCMLVGVWRKITRLCDKDFPMENGGILIGSYDRTLRIAQIKDTFISKRNKASDCSLVREPAEANKLLRRIWILSCKRKYFIGEWHSHPNGSNTPSCLDDESLTTIAKNKKCECSRPVLIIFNGNKGIGWKADRAWLYTREGKRLKLIANY